MTALHAAGSGGGAAIALANRHKGQGRKEKRLMLVDPEELEQLLHPIAQKNEKECGWRKQGSSAAFKKASPGKKRLRTIRWQRTPLSRKKKKRQSEKWEN